MMSVRFVKPVAVLVCGLACGCTSRAPVEASLVYPVDKLQTDTIDLQALRNETSLSMTNTTARALGPGRVWVNQQWSMACEGLGVGETRRFDLGSFANEHGEYFRAGGFFATERPDTMAQVQYEEDGAETMIGLVAVNQRPR